MTPRDSLIKIAWENPQLRDDLLPVIMKLGGFDRDPNDQELYKHLKKVTPAVLRDILQFAARADYPGETFQARTSDGVPFEVEAFDPHHVLVFNFKGEEPLYEDLEDLAGKFGLGAYFYEQNQLAKKQEYSHLEGKPDYEKTYHDAVKGLARALEEGDADRFEHDLELLKAAEQAARGAGDTTRADFFKGELESWDKHLPPEERTREDKSRPSILINGIKTSPAKDTHEYHPDWPPRYTWARGRAPNYTCDDCGKHYKVWTTDDRIWKKLDPTVKVPRASLCPKCFAGRVPQQPI